MVAMTFNVYEMAFNIMKMNFLMNRQGKKYHGWKSTFVERDKSIFFAFISMITIYPSDFNMHN